MNRSRTRTRALGAVLVFAATLLVVAYAVGAGPFGGSAEVTAEDVCGTVGDRERAADALNTLLPEKEEYDFVSRDARRAEDAATYTSSCIARSGDDTLAAATAELVTTESDRAWLDRLVRADYEEDERAEEIAFPSGDEAVATPRRAAILVPCLPAGVIPGGPRELSVTVHLDRDTAAASGGRQSRQALADLAVGTARHAHERAACTLSSELPGQAPRIGRGT